MKLLLPKTDKMTISELPSFIFIKITFIPNYKFCHGNLTIPKTATATLKLNSSTINELGKWFLKMVEPESKLNRARSVSLTTLWAETAWIDAQIHAPLSKSPCHPCTHSEGDCWPPILFLVLKLRLATFCRNHSKCGQKRSQFSHLMKLL